MPGSEWRSYPGFTLKGYPDLFIFRYRHNEPGIAF